MTYVELLERRANDSGDQPFVYFNDEILTFGRLEINVNKTANMLKKLGIVKGDHVCLLLPNCLEFIYLWFGLAKIGGVMVPLNPSLRGDGLKYVINHSNSKIIFVHSNLFGPFAFVRKGLEHIENVVGVGHGKPASPEMPIFNELLAESPQSAPPVLEIAPSDPLGIIYTSGTTGPPMGAMISHFNYLNSGKVWLEEVIDYQSDDVFFTSLPLFHANAQMFTTMGSLYSGRPFVLREKFSASRFFDEIRKYEATVFNYIGGILTMLMKQPQREDDTHNPIRVTFGGAAPKEIWQDFEKRFDLTIIEGYGLTESGGVSLCNPPQDIKVGSIGRPLNFCDVDIFDKDDQQLPLGETGEIVIRERTSNSMFLGYYNQKDKTKEAWRSGWFHTGDRGYMDLEGYFFFVDRIKDCIRRRGENISSFDIEKIINSHWAVLEAAAIAVPSELGEDDVKVFVVLRENQELAPEDLLEYCEERMAYFMVPRYVQYTDILPKTATQRVQKFKLREIGIGDAWDREKAGYKLKRL
jgi:carnitine-CoA ligase